MKRFYEKMPHILAAALLACSAGCGAADDATEDDAETVAQRESALADCSTDLGACYEACQNVTPSPTAECFTNCSCTFYRCIDMPSSDCQLSQ